ncbi:hypothetical protein MN116_002635 [Schistosoma mekongi]|uniref:Uncharacterized protein n=1 Tax=Schistosoma mekongi TaxID=38744 RepID=A0AAE2D8G2_SCHME|nr:hypothetical protein MN116_002635 [Schistosoma mekongi]
MSISSTDYVNDIYNSPMYPMFTKTPNVSPANSVSHLHSYNYTTDENNFSNQQNQHIPCPIFSRKSKLTFNLLPNQWSFMNNNTKFIKGINPYAANGSRHKQGLISGISTIDSIKPFNSVNISSFMSTNLNTTSVKQVKHQAINNKRTKTPITSKTEVKETSHQSEIVKDAENARYLWLTRQTQRSTPALNQERQYGRINLISTYRGESPSRRGRSETSSARTEHRGGLFQVHENNRTKPPYYIIHPEWLSETITIRQLGLSPRPTPLPITNGLNYDHIKRRSHTTNSICPESSSRNKCTDSVSLEQASLNRCRSVPPKSINPITWSC